MDIYWHLSCQYSVHNNLYAKGGKMKSLLKFLSIISLFFILSVGTGFGQSLYFCEGVDDDGYPEGESSSFTIGSNGGYLYTLVRLNYEVNSDKVYFDIYKVNSRGKETFDNTIDMETESNWTWFWKKITFYDDGTYNVYVTDEDGYPLVSGSVKISFR